MDIEKGIKLILDSELSAYGQNGRIRGGLGTFNIKLQSVPNGGWTHEGAITKYLFDEPDKDFIQSENSKLILDIYSSANQTERDNIESILLNFLAREATYTDIAYLIGFIFVRLDKTLVMLKKAITDLRGDTRNAYSNLLFMLKLIIAREYAYFDSNTLLSIIELLKDDKEAEVTLLSTLREASKRAITRNLSKHENPEIIKDMQNLTGFFQKNFIDDGISNQIKHIEDLFNSDSQFDNIVYATCVGRVRVLISDVTKIFAIERSRNTTKILSRDKEDKVYSKYLYDNKHISEQEFNLLVAFYSLCSNNGSHVSKTEKETARLVKNIGFEIVSLLARYIDDCRT